MPLHHLTGRDPRQSPSERREYFDSLLQDTLGHPASAALFRDEELIGSALIAPLSETTAHLAWIGIAPEHRRRGLGGSLLRCAMRTCSTHRIERMSLYTDTSVGAQTLYSRLGFERAGTLTYRWRPTT